MHRPVAALALVLGASTIWMSPAAAQEFRGEVTDEIGTPLPEVRIGLFALGGEMVASGMSGPEGEFSIVAPADGEYTVHFTRQGFRSISGGPYELLGADLALEALVVMHRAPTALPGIEAEVEGVSPRLVTAGFYERRDKGFGYFFDRIEIERRGNVRLSDLLEPLPGLWVQRGFTLSGPGQVQNPPLWHGRGTVRCAPSLWIDGMLVRNGGMGAKPLRPDDFVWTLDLEGVEFYGGPSQAPIEYSRSAGCAVLVLWTRGPPERRRGGG